MHALDEPLDVDTISEQFGLGFGSGLLVVGGFGEEA